MVAQEVEFGVTSILNTKQFSWVFLVECIMILLLGLFTLFYFSQFLSWICTRVLGYYMWKHHRVTLVIGSLQISFFGGQIFVKNVKFIGKDKAISIVYATLHWRFWLRKTRVAALFAEDLDQIQKAACALSCEIHGLELFVFNRSLAYDNIYNMANGIIPPRPIIEKDLSITEQNLMRLLPLEVKFRQFAACFGNHNTESLLVLTSKEVDIIVDVDRASNDLDRYMLVVTSKWKRPNLTLYPNLDYKMAKRNVFLPEKGPWYRLGRPKHKQSGAWRGLNRYNANDHDDKVQTSEFPEEYARVSCLFEAEEMSLEHVVDMAGPIIETEKPVPPPVNNFNVVFTSASVNYGPWADKQRVQLMEQFFPQVAIEATPAEGAPGTKRLTPKMKITFDFVNNLNVHVPIREFSKDLQWTHHLINSQAANVTRPYGWIDFFAGEGTNGSIEVDLIAMEYGYRNKVHVFLNKLEVRTSVNHDLAMKMDSHTVTIVQNSPLKWNGLQVWNIDHASKACDFFFLREQAALMTDYARDQSTRDEVDYFFFVPTVYNVHWTVSDFRLLFNVNNQNIINNPTSTIENTFLIFKAKVLDLDVRHLAHQVRPLTNTTKVGLFTEQLDLEVSAPPWHMLHSFLESPHLGRVHDFKIDVDYTYNTTEDNTRPETESINVSGRDFTLVAFGFAINYLMTIRENYFGQSYHFQTSEEYHQRMELGEEIREEYEFSRYDADLDVQMHFDVSNCCLVLPAYLYSAKDCVSMHFAGLVADMRFTNYYMDLQAELMPITGYLHYGLAAEDIPDLAQGDPLKLDGISMMFVSETIISAHRMFGLPPTEPTYLCYWKINVGDILIDGPLEIVSVLARIGRFSSHSFRGVENKPITVEPALYDVNFLSVEVKSVSLVLHTQDDARLELRMSTISIDRNDYANERYSGRMSGSIPNIEFRGFSQDEMVVLFQTSISWSGFLTVPEPERHYQLQQEHIALHDMLFHRCPFLLDQWHRSNPPYSTEPPDHIVPTLALPPLPPQLTQQIVMSANPQTIALDFEREFSSKFSASSRSQYSASNENLFSSAESSESSDNSESSARARANYRPASYTFGNTEKFYGFLPPENFEQFTTQRPDYDFNLENHEWYPGAPALSTPDSSRSYKDLVVEFGPIDGTILPQTVRLLDSITLSLSAFDVVAAFDMLHCDIVDALTEDNELECMRSYVRAGLVNVRFGLAKEDGAGINSSFSRDDILLEPNYILLTMEKLGAMFQRGDSGTPTAANLEVETLNLSITGPEDAFTNTAVAIRVSHVAGWMVVFDDDSAGQIHANHVDLFWSSNQTRWVTNYMLHLIYEFHRLKKLAKANVSRHDEMAYAVLEVARASERHNIEQDSYVLSRPFGGLQSGDHVRSHISWRISVRLRHLLNLLPADEIEEMEAVLTGRNYSVPDDVKKQVVDIFSRWRSWELTEDLESALIFTRTFGPPPSKWDSTSVVMRCEIDDIATRIIYDNNIEDFIVLDYLSLYATLRPTVATVFTGLFVTCARSRSHLSHRLLEPIATLTKTVTMFEHPELFDDMFNKSTLKFENKRGTQTSARIIKGHIFAFVQDFGFEVELKSFSAELQCNQLQAMNVFITSSSHWYHSTMAAMSTMCLSVSRRGGGDLFDYIMDNIGLGLVSWETYTRIACDVGALSLVSNAKLVDFCEVVTEFFKIDVDALRDFVGVMRKSRSQLGSELDLNNSESTRSASTKTEGEDESDPIPIHLNVEVKTLTIKMNVVDNLQAVLTGETLIVRTRQPDYITTLADFHIDRGILSIVYGTKKSVASIELLDVSNLLRYEPKSGAVETILAVKKAKLDTMELLWLLDLQKEKNIFAEIEHMSDIISSMAVQYSDAPETLPSVESLSELSPVKPSLIRYQIQVTEAQLSLPLQDSTFTIIMHYFSGQYYNFKRDDRDAPQSCPLELSGSLDEFRVELATATIPPSTPIAPTSPAFRPPILAFQLTASYSYERNNQRIQVSSSYCKLVLDPVRVVAILQAVATLDSRANFFDTLDRSQEPQKSTNNRESIVKAIEGISAVLSLNDQSFTWLTRTGGSFVAGHEMLNIRQTGLTARMDIHGFYAQPQSQHLQKSTRAAIPSIVLSAVMLQDEDDDYFVYLNNTGESLSIDISSSVVPLLVGIADSLDETKRLYSAGLAKNLPKVRRGSVGSSSSPRSPIRLPFSFHGKSSISSARLRLFEEYSTESVPSLELQSPAAELVMDYRRKHMPVRDSMVIQVNISESSNTVYPRALQEIRNIARMIKFQLQNRHQNQVIPSVPPPPSVFHTPTAPSEPTTPTKPRKLRVRTDLHHDDVIAPSQKSVSDFQTLLSNIEYTVLLQLSAQKLILSCEPFAKVATNLHCDSIKILLTSPKDDDDNEYFALTGTIKGMRISLQHVFSHEMSADAGIGLFTFTMIHRHNSPTRPLELGVLTANPEFSIKVNKLNDIQSFIDIWTPVPSSGVDVVQPMSPSVMSPQEEMSPMQTYRKAMASVSFQWSFVWHIREVKGEIDLGQSIGKAELTLDRIWLSSLKKSQKSQFFALGIGNLLVSCEGRLGGALEIKGTNGHLTVEFNEELDQTPEVLFVAGVPSVSAYLSLDFNPFLALCIERSSLAMGNIQKACLDYDDLEISYECEQASATLTALAASHLYDMVDIISAFKISSNLDMSMNNDDPVVVKKHEVNLRNLNLLTRLKVKLHLHLGATVLYIFPSDLSESSAVCITSGGTRTVFTQWVDQSGLHSEFEFETRRLLLSLAAMQTSFVSSDVTSVKVHTFFREAALSTKTNIITIPQCKVQMYTLLKPNGRHLYYRFLSDFMGTVEIGWNLGSVAFIRELAAVHSKAWDVRKKIFLASKDTDTNEPVDENDIPAPPEPHQLRSPTQMSPGAHGQSDDLTSYMSHEDFETARKLLEALVRSDLRFAEIPRYHSIEPPQINIPQLHDMGEATPPVEWIGLDRQKLPEAVHWYLMRALNGIILQVELVYGNVIEHM